MRFDAVGVGSSDGIDAGSDAGAAQRIAVVLHEELEDRVRRGIVIAARALRDLLLRLRRDEAPRERIERERQAATAACAAAAARATRRAPCSP